MLYPHQMDNNVYINLKKNLEKKVINKCFSRYGYIIKIIEIINHKFGIIEAENTEASALFDVSFSCKLCAPLKNKQIICQIDKINRVLITAVNGPILIIIPNNRINDKLFFKDNNDNIRYKNEGSTSVPLQPKDFIKVTLKTIEFNDGEERIKAIGFIDNMATEEEKKKYYDDMYTSEQGMVDINEYGSDVNNKVDDNEQEIKD
jgi:DNA-directed RNA polymerase subunit E'/Rpb7